MREKKVPGSKIEKLLDVIPQVIFPAGVVDFSAKIVLKLLAQLVKDAREFVGISE